MVNSNTEKLFGLKEEQLLGKCWTELGIAEKSCFLWAKEFEKVLQGSNHPGVFNIDITSPHGEDKYMRIYATHEYDDQGRVEYILVIGEDISLQKNGRGCKTERGHLPEDIIGFSLTARSMDLSQ